jgi:1,4-alpha-glucan branching enzyme
MASRIYFNNDDGWAASPVESLNYMESHDESTIAYAMGGLNSGTRLARSRMAAVVLATSLGNPMIWMGQEFLRSREAQNINEAPLDWTLLTSNQSLYNYYAGVFRLRRNNPAMRQSSSTYFTWEYTPWSGDPQVIGYSLRSPDSGDKKFVVLINFDAGSSKTVSLHFPEDGTWTKVVTEASVDQTGTISVSGGYYSVTVGANSGIIFMK